VNEYQIDYRRLIFVGADEKMGSKKG